MKNLIFFASKNILEKIMVFGNFSKFEHFFGELRVELGVRPKKIISDSEKPLEQETFFGARPLEHF